MNDKMDIHLYIYMDKMHVNCHGCHQINSNIDLKKCVEYENKINK
jgi:mono/diheme cytochrome c family protein